MSLLETQEQRQIRQLRAKIRYMENQQRSSKKENKELERIIRQAKEELAAVQARQKEKIRKQRERERKFQEAIQSPVTAIRNMDRKVRERIRLQREKIRNMQQQGEKEAARMQADFKDAAGKIQASVDDTRREMKEGFAKIGKETDAKIAALRKETAHEMEVFQREIKEKIKETDSKVNQFMAEYREKENSEQELASYWMEQVVRLYEELVEEYRPELFKPKEIERLAAKIGMMREDLEGGRYTSAADGGREAFYEAMDLKEELALEEIQWNYWFQAYKERQSKILEMLEACENREYEMEYQGRKIRDRHGIDYWTGGQLTIVRDRIYHFHRDNGDMTEVSTDRLREAAEEAGRLIEEVALVENAAHTNVAMSLSRMEMAGKIGAILGESYQMLDADGDFFSEENREEYHAIFENEVTGDQAAVVITPIMGEDGTVTNHIELIIGNADNNPVTRDKISEVVAGKLREGGMEGAAFPCSGKYGNKTREEVQRVGDLEAVAAGDESARGAGA